MGAILISTLFPLILRGRREEVGALRTPVWIVLDLVASCSLRAKASDRAQE
jgi:hypothetical protein